MSNQLTGADRSVPGRKRLRLGWCVGISVFVVVATLAAVYYIDAIEERITRRPEPVYAYTRLPYVRRLSRLLVRESTATRQV